MGHHIDSEGRFQSDRHPDLAPDKIVLSFKDMRARSALMALAEAYHDVDPGLAEDIFNRLLSTVHDDWWKCDKCGVLNHPTHHCGRCGAAPPSSPRDTGGNDAPDT